MPLVDLPSLPEVDYSRQGRLKIAWPVIAGLLRLPPGHEILYGHGDNEWLELLIAGADMPSEPDRHPEDDHVAQVSLICRVEQDENRRRVFASWAHLPEKTWLVSDLPIT